MENYQKFEERLIALFNNQNLAVLSTHHEGQPYASLVAFYASADLKSIYFATPKTTRKYANIEADNRVALMINSSSNQASDFHKALAVTAVGKATTIEGSDKERILEQYLSKHPHLEAFVLAPTCALVGVSVESYYMVRNFQYVTEMHIET